MFWQKKTAMIRSNPAYQAREERDLRMIEGFGCHLGAWGRAERQRNHAIAMADERMLRDIDEVDTVTVATCANCGRPMTVQLNGNGKGTMIWLACCSNGMGGKIVSVPARSINRS